MRAAGGGINEDPWFWARDATTRGSAPFLAPGGRSLTQAAPPDFIRYNEASTKAESLLKYRLGEVEWRLFQTTGRIVQPSKRWPSVDYFLQRGDRVQVVDGGRLTTLLCVTPMHGEPEADRLMTILDLIETDERRLWQMANVSRAAGHSLALGISRWERVGEIVFFVSLALSGVLIVMAVWFR